MIPFLVSCYHRSLSFAQTDVRRKLLSTPDSISTYSEYGMVWERSSLGDLPPL